MADEKPGGLVSKIPKDYPVSPDIEDRRNEVHSLADNLEHISHIPKGPVEVDIQPRKPSYDQARKARKQ